MNLLKTNSILIIGATIFLIAVALLVPGQTGGEHAYYTPEPIEHWIEPELQDEKPEETVEDMIRRFSVEYNVDTETAIRIAWCESRFDPLTKNPNSSATGVYQFITGTWEWIGSPGDRTNAEDNIRAFMEYYPRYPSWWVCQ